MHISYFLFIFKLFHRLHYKKIVDLFIYITVFKRYFSPKIIIYLYHCAQTLGKDFKNNNNNL